MEESVGHSFRPICRSWTTVWVWVWTQKSLFSIINTGVSMEGFLVLGVDLGTCESLLHCRDYQVAEYVYSVS
jgi:hypothetical protein